MLAGMKKLVPLVVLLLAATGSLAIVEAQNNNCNYGCAYVTIIGSRQSGPLPGGSPNYGYCGRHDWATGEKVQSLLPYWEFVHHESTAVPLWYGLGVLCNSYCPTPPGGNPPSSRAFSGPDNGQPAMPLYTEVLEGHCYNS